MNLCYRYRSKDNVILFSRYSREEGLFTEYIIDKSVTRFEEDILNIYHYIFEYGIDSMGEDISQEALTARREYFIGKVHEGLVLAQDKIIEVLLNINSESHHVKTQLKKANVERNKDLIKELMLKLKDLSNREYIVRKLADAIAWGYIIQDHPTARRLNIGRDIDSIENSDLKSYLKFAKDYSAKNKSNFCFLTDITSFIQIGDAICSEIDTATNTGHWNLVEFKSGERNRKILDILETGSYNNSEIMSSLTKKEIDQGLRIINQYKRMDAAVSTIEEGKGIDAKGRNVHAINVEDIKIIYYSDVINDMIETLEENEWSIKVIDDCLYLGLYDTNIPLKKAYHAFGEWMKAIDVKYPITNFQLSFTCPLCKPPFLTGLRKRDIVDIAMGKKIILASLDFDKWFEIGEKIGLSLEWLNRSESNKYLKEREGTDLYVNGKKIIKIEANGSSSVMGDAIPARIFFEFLRPVSAIDILKDSFQVMAEKGVKMSLDIPPQS